MPSQNPMIGRTLSHYQIVDQLGAGGMGVVYLYGGQRAESDIWLMETR